MSFWTGVLIASLIWVVVCFFAFLRGMNWSFDWSDGFNSGWDAAMEIAEKKGEQENG